MNTQIYNYDEITEFDDFIIIGDSINSRIPASKINDWREFISILDNPFFNKPNKEFIFRGHRKHQWTLEPTLARVKGNGIVDETIAERQLKLFKLNTRGRLNNAIVLDDNQKDELWSIGQHHGLQTPLIDWTTSPYVALFFAFNKKDIDESNKYRTVFAINKTFLEKHAKKNEVRLLEPLLDEHGRLVNQAGLFTIAPYGKSLESTVIEMLEEENIDIEDPHELANYICKIYIPNIDRNDCLKNLRRMNVHHSSLFPDLIDACEHCNILISEEGNFEDSSESQGKMISAKTEISLDNSIIDMQFKNYKLTPENDVLKPLVQSLLKGSDTKQDLDLKDLNNVAKIVLNFINEDAGVDWYKRDSQLARIRTTVRRELVKINFNEDLISQAVANIVKVAAELSENADNKNKMN